MITKLRYNIHIWVYLSNEGNGNAKMRKEVGTSWLGNLHIREQLQQGFVPLVEKFLHDHVFNFFPSTFPIILFYIQSRQKDSCHCCSSFILLGRPNIGPTRYDVTIVLPSPLPHVITDSSFAHRDIHVHPDTESMRFVRHQSDRTMLSQNVTCCIFGAICDRFVSPIMCIN